jgi:pyruvate dehydrogenase E1 component
VFCGDGEMDEPESLGAIGLAARENLDNLVFVINCNLQRLDGPVRGNGKIIQELEGEFRGAGWNVIKLLWGKGWDELLARDKTASSQLMMECWTATTRPSRPTTAPTCASTSSASTPSR